MTALLALDGVARTYPGAVPVYALRPTTIEVAEGAYVTITGPSGAGKSTLLNVLGLLDRPTAGHYLVAGIETANARERVRGAVRGQMFGFVFQAFHLLAGRTVQENVELGMLYGPVGRRARRELAAQALDRMRMSHRRFHDPRALSGGERQRVAIARAIAPGPRVLFCDEPTGNLDSRNTQNVLTMLRELHDSGLTLVVVTHDDTVAAQGQRRLEVIDGVVAEAARTRT